MNFPVYYQVVVHARVRFESVYQKEAEAFARELYKAEYVIADILEVSR
jgi:hypothetical protein